MVRMTVEGVGYDHRKQTVVLLKDMENRRLLPIWIGAAEARAIAMQIEGVTPPRPMPHDLILNAIQMVGGHVMRVLISDLQEGTFYATIDIEAPGGVLHLDARPSDAIAVAVRARCPVFVDGNVEDELIEIAEENISLPSDAAPSSTNGDSEEEARFQRLLGDLDF